MYYFIDLFIIYSHFDIANVMWYGTKYELVDPPKFLNFLKILVVHLSFTASYATSI